MFALFVWGSFPIAISSWRTVDLSLFHQQDDAILQSPGLQLILSFISTLSPYNLYSNLFSMSRPRALSGADAPKEPHSVSLKGM